MASIISNRGKSSVSTDRVIIRGGVIDFKPGNSMCDFGAVPPVNANPTAPDECTFSLRNNVTGRPVMNGVEDAMRPSLKVWFFSSFNLNMTQFRKRNRLTLVA